MNKGRTIVAAGLGAMTPAFIATDQVQGRSIDGASIAPAQSGVPAIALDQEALKNALLELSPAEKLRIAGDRIRLAAKAKVSTPSGASAGRGQKAYTVDCRTYQCPAPRQAR
jgi:hypothetical protein